MFMRFETISRSALIGGFRSAGERVGFPERLPAASVGPAKAGYFIPCKVIGSRVNSDSAVTNADNPVAAVKVGSHAAAAGRSMKRFSNASNRLSMSARSSLKSFEIAQTLIDISFVLVALFSLALFALAVGFSIFILLFFALQA